MRQATKLVILVIQMVWGSIDQEIVNGLKENFDRNNVLVKMFRIVRDHYEIDSLTNIYK